MPYALQALIFERFQRANFSKKLPNGLRKPAFRFYTPFYGLENIPYEFGKREDYKNPQNILSQLDSFKGQPRVWILLSHVYEKGDFNEKDFILSYLN